MALTVTIILAVLTTMTGIFWAATVDPLVNISVFEIRLVVSLFALTPVREDVK